MKALDFKNISFIYNKNSSFEKKALSDISFNIEPSEVLAICGNTGSGKSTLVKLMNGLLKVSEGKVFVFDKDLSDIEDYKKIRKEVGMVFQYPDHQIFETDVKREMIYAPLKFGFSKKESLKKVRESCDLYGFDYLKYKNRNPFELSGGEKRKVAICSILSYDPEIIIFDEPTAGLDNISREKMIQLIGKLKKMGKTIIVISHDIEFIESVSSKIVVISDSFQVFHGDVFDFMSSFSTEKLKKFGIDKPFKYRVMEYSEKKDINIIKDFEGSI